MAHLRALFETHKGNRSAVLCADAASNFLVLTYTDGQAWGRFVTDDFLFAVGYGQSFVLEGLPVPEIEAYSERLVPIKAVKARVEPAGEASMLVITSRNKVLFRKLFATTLDAEMMSESYLETLAGWQLVKAKSEVHTRARVILSRANERHEARILRLCRGRDGVGEGIVLEIREAGRLILSRFGLLAAAIQQGNSFTWPHREIVYRPDEDTRFYGAPLQLTETQEAGRQPQGESEALYVYELGSIRTAVVMASIGKPLPGYFIELYVEEQLIGKVMRSQGEGGYFPLPLAIRKAQDLLKQLQGWHSAPQVRV